jgi:hypothetical protein
MLYSILKTDIESLVYSSPDSDQWKKLQPHLEYIEIHDEQEIIKSYEKFSNWVVLGNAVLSKGLVGENNLMKFFLTGMYGSLYFFHLKSRHDQFRYYVANPDLKISKYLWNSIDINVVSTFYNSSIPRIKLNQIIYIPKTDPDFIKNHGFLEDILSIIENGNNEEYKYAADEEIHNDEFGYISKDANFHYDENLEDNLKYYTTVRILYNDVFPYDFESKCKNVTMSQTKMFNSNQINTPYLN